jgi:hypothetical protein
MQEAGMSDTAVLIDEIQSLPPHLAAEVLDFVGYLKQKNRKEAAEGGTGDTPEYLRRKAREGEDAGLFKLHAGELNREAEDALKYQIDPFETIPPYEHDV